MNGSSSFETAMPYLFRHYLEYSIATLSRIVIMAQSNLITAAYPWLASSLAVGSEEKEKEEEEKNLIIVFMLN